MTLKNYFFLLVFLIWNNFCLAQNGSQPPLVELKTDIGTITLELNIDRAPITVNNFLEHVSNYHYDGVIFHRVIKNFMIQSGGFTFDLTPKDTDRNPIENESKNGLSNKRGSIAMARTGDPNSGKAQFFINHKDNIFLDGTDDKWGYAVFGKVKFGMSVVDKIAEMKTQKLFGPFTDIPQKRPMILSAKIISQGSWKKEDKAIPSLIERPIPLTETM
ncbi:MAG: peptidylprolyl isomerase A [Porticoccaceae bacterium]|nr:peptidylprolyl isomerase A [Porticoccaceae bacterium]